MLMTPHHAMNDGEVRMLRKELELLMGERQVLLRIAGLAAGFIAELDSKVLPRDTYDAAELLAEHVNALPEETLKEALEAVQAHSMTA
jgi:hypothetical protein